MEIETLEKIKKPKIELDPETQFDVERQVMVRSWYPFSTGVRIWPNTYLRCNNTNKKAKLLYTDNVGKYPNWTQLKPNERFLMVFEALPDQCLRFDLIEDIPEPGGFYIRMIPRDKIDVYDVPMIEGSI